MLSQPEQLGLTKREQNQLPQFVKFLTDHPTPFGQALLGLTKDPWKKRDIAAFESSVLKLVSEKRQLADFLAIARSAAHRWSVSLDKYVPFPRYYYNPGQKDESILGADYAYVVGQYRAWRTQLTAWVKELFPRGSERIDDRGLLVAALVTSAMLHGGAFGVRLAAAIVRAIEHKWERTFVIGGRVHIELDLSWHAIEAAEIRLWLPDPLTATLWAWVEPADVEGFLDPVSIPQSERRPNDIQIFRRLGQVIRRACHARSALALGGLPSLRRSCLMVTHTELRPVLAHYCDGEISSDSLERHYLRRLFPKGELIRFAGTVTRTRALGSSSVQTTNKNPASPPAWIDTLLTAAETKSPSQKVDAIKKALCVLETDPKAAVLARRLAGFGVSLLSATLHSGKRLERRQLSKILGMLAASLGPMFGDREDIARTDMPALLDAVTRAILARPIRERRSLIKWILEFDHYLRTRVKERTPIPKSELPWPREQAPTVDIGLATHEEYSDILRRIDRLWDARDSVRRRRMVRLMVILSFRCGLRRNEIRTLRVGGVMFRGSPEMLIWPRKGDPQKSRNARRRVPIGVLLSDDELNELKRWHSERINEGAKSDHYCFAVPDERMKLIPETLFGKLNKFLREQSRWNQDPEESGVHIHTLRHAYGGWLFAALHLPGEKLPDTLFPDLDESRSWLVQRHRRNLLGPKSGGILPAFVAATAGHAEFRTTAHSYIHLFPWVVAAHLDQAAEMAPDDSLVKLASRKDATYRDWVNKGEIHNVPIRLLQQNYPGFQVEPEPRSARGGLPPSPSSCSTWAELAWDRLRRWCNSDPVVQPDSDLIAMAERAEILSKLKLPGQKFRHVMETYMQNGKVKLVVRLHCPSKPPLKLNGDFARLCKRIVELHASDSALVRKATGVFVRHLEERDWVRFNSFADSIEANQYIQFLCLLLGVSKIALVSGATKSSLNLKDAWESSLMQPNLRIRLAGDSRNFGPKSAISIRPIAGLGKGIGMGHAEFRFLMTMAYIKFGAQRV